MKNDIYNVLVRPLVTEKGTDQAEKLNSYAFEVNPKATKEQIRQAVEKIYSVRVVQVRTSNRRGKRRRIGYKMGTTSHWKKAVVVLHADYHIDMF